MSPGRPRTPDAEALDAKATVIRISPMAYFAPAFVALSVVGIVFSYIVDAVEVLLMPWQRKDS
jgi:hypothetical protein